jgi:hypothetical protein
MKVFLQQILAAGFGCLTSQNKLQAIAAAWVIGRKSRCKSALARYETAMHWAGGGSRGAA